MKVEYHKVDYKDFGYKNSEVYNHVYNMTKDYGFWFSGWCNKIRDTNMTEYTLKKSKTHKHKFVLYNLRDTNIFYLVQYCKSLIKIYYCYDGKYQTIKKNINKAYKKGLDDYIWKKESNLKDSK